MIDEVKKNIIKHGYDSQALFLVITNKINNIPYI